MNTRYVKQNAENSAELNRLNFKNLIQPICKRVFFVFGCLIFIGSNYSQAQCKSDSVVTYQVIGDNRVIASVEYFTYDLKDSLLTNRLIEYQNGKAFPLYENRYSYSKLKGNTVISYENCKWVAERAVFKPVVKVTRTYSKNGLLISEIHDDLSAEPNPANVDTKIDFSYTKTGDLISNLLSRWNSATNSWVGESYVAYEYKNGLMSETTTSDWDSSSQDWKAKWRSDYVYDANKTLLETVSYRFENYAWIPDTRTYYGLDSSQALKGVIVQKWNGGKRGWDNQSYYVMKLNSKEQTDTEIHLSWSGKEWLVDLTFFYIYNEQGQVIQILNDKREVMVDRFCR
jgi:hypothetical protein